MSATRSTPSSSSLAGRTLSDADAQLTLFAVGDDDQNIYAFKGSSVRFIRSFEQDYRAKPEFLTDNLPLHASHHRGGERGNRAGPGSDKGRQ